MKKLVIIMLAMLSMQGIAQEVEIQQTINEKINSLYIGHGWDVRFIQPRDSLSDKELKNIPTTISIIVPEELASKAQSVTPIEYDSKELRLKDNSYLPENTIVEIRSTFYQIKNIILENHATVTADYFMLNPPSKVSKLILKNDSKMSIRYWAINVFNKVSLQPYSTLEIDTITGSGIISTNKGNLQINTYIETDITVYEDSAPNNNLNPPLIPEGEYVSEKDPLVQYDSIRRLKIIHFDTSYSTKLSNSTLTVSFGYYLTTTFTGNDAYRQSPYFSNNGVGVRVPIIIHLPLNRKWDINAGVQYDFCVMNLWNQVTTNDDGNLTMTNTIPSKHNSILGHYIGIPLGISFQSATTRPSIGFDITPAFLVSERFGTATVDYNWKGQTEKTSLLNPIKLEASLSWTMNIIGRYYGFRVFTNLLPQFRKSTDAPKTHTFGVELIF